MLENVCGGMPCVNNTAEKWKNTAFIESLVFFTSMVSGRWIFLLETSFFTPSTLSSKKKTLVKI
jgi:hypothetical protein